MSTTHIDTESASISHAGKSQLKLFHLIVPNKSDE
jgi:hypothetical protein